MNKPINKEEFLNKFSKSKISYPKRATEVAKSVLTALSIAAFSLSAPVMAKKTSKEAYQVTFTPQFKTEAAQSQYSPGEVPLNLNYSTFKQISEEKRSGIYQHPYKEDETIVMFMLGDRDAIGKISADYEALNDGEKLPSKISEMVEEREKFNYYIDGSTVRQGDNFSSYTNNLLSPKSNFILMDTVFSMNHENALKNNDPERDSMFFYYAYMHEVGHSLEHQKINLLEYAMSHFVGLDKPGGESSADFSSILYSSQDFKKDNISNDKILDFMGDIKGIREQNLDNSVKNGSNSYYFGQTSLTVAIQMIKENPELLNELSTEKIEKITEVLYEKTQTHDFSKDFKDGLDITGNDMQLLLSDMEKLRTIAHTNPDGFDAAAKKNKDDINNYLALEPNKATEFLALSAFTANEIQGMKEQLLQMHPEDMGPLLKDLITLKEAGHLEPQLLGDLENAAKLVSETEDFPAFRVEVMQELNKEGLWHPGKPLEPEFNIGNLAAENLRKLDTQVLEIVLDNTIKSQSIVWEPGRDKVPNFLDVSGQDILKKAEEYGFDINEVTESGRVDLFFKDSDKTAIVLNLDMESITPEFYEHSLRLLHEERRGNIKQLFNDGSNQVEAHETKSNYSSYAKNEIVIQEINYSQLENRPAITSDVAERENELDKPKISGPRLPGR